MYYLTLNNSFELILVSYITLMVAFEIYNPRCGPNLWSRLFGLRGELQLYFVSLMGHFYVRKVGLGRCKHQRMLEGV